jgi:TonB-dependent starch-binding outer membrane protein SusC
MDQKGLTKFTDFKRYTARINTTYKKNRLSVAQNLSVGYRAKTPTPDTRAIDLPTLPIDSAGAYYSGGPEYYILGNRITNPLAAPFYTTNKRKNLDLIGNLNLGYEIIKGLNYRFEISGSLNSLNNFSHSPRYYTRYLPNGSGDRYMEMR